MYLITLTAAAITLTAVSYVFGAAGLKMLNKADVEPALVSFNNTMEIYVAA